MPGHILTESDIEPIVHSVIDAKVAASDNEEAGQYESRRSWIVTELSRAIGEKAMILMGADGIDITIRTPQENDEVAREICDAVFEEISQLEILRCTNQRSCGSIAN